MQLNKAPSYKAVVLAILSNDVTLKSLGYQPSTPQCYHDIKRSELQGRRKIKQLELF